MTHGWVTHCVCVIFGTCENVHLLSVQCQDLINCVAHCPLQVSMLSGQRFAVVCPWVRVLQVSLSTGVRHCFDLEVLMRLSQLEARIEVLSSASGAATVRAIITAIIFNVCDPFCHS